MKKLLVALMLLIVTPFCFAAATSPATQLQQIANRMVTQLESNKSKLHSMSVIRRIVNQTLLPTVDMDRMASSVVGRDWRSATDAQRTQFKKEFSYLVTTTYASALASYDGDKVNFQPIRGDYATSQTLRVNSMIVRKNGQRISITYDVLRSGNEWKVYDFSIEHVSMVQSYRSQFSGVLASGGMPALLTRLQGHNGAGKK
jgi:phospholipid transport system substrate-binding protein